MIKKGSRVIWRVTSGFCTLEWEGTVTAVRKHSCYVVFDSGGHWLEMDDLVLKEGT